MSFVIDSLKNQHSWSGFEINLLTCNHFLMKLCLFFFLVIFNGFISHAQHPVKKEIKFEILKFKAFNGDTLFYDYGMLKVPENRLKAQSQAIELAVLKLKTQAVNPGFPIIFLSGGPGQSGIDYIKEAYFQKLIFQLQQNHDIVLLDQRGSGRSLPSLKFKLPEADNTKMFLSEERLINLWNEAASIGAEELLKQGVDIAGYNTVQNADDLDDLRIALGAEKINLLAFSYGTHLALATTKRYPESVDNMVLIGTSGLDQMHYLPSTFDKQLKLISDLAAQDSGIYEQVPDMLSLLKRVIQKLESQPISVYVKDYRARKIVELPIGKFGLQFLLRLDAGDSKDFIYFPALLYGIEHGDYRLLQTFAEKRYNQFNGSQGTGILAVRQASGASEERLIRIHKEGKTALLGNAMNTPDIYAGWKNVDLGNDYRASFICGIKTLFISGSLDSNTPPSNVEEIISEFIKSQHIIVENAGHEHMLPHEQVHDRIVSFFRGESIIKNNIQLPKPKLIHVF